MTSHSGKEGLNVRYRSRTWESGEESLVYARATEELAKRKDRTKVKALIVPLVYPLTVFFILFQLVIYLDRRLPLAVSISDAVNKKGSAFSAERAMGHLTLLTGIGPRVTGSHENEVLAVDYLMREVNWATSYLTAREKERVTIMKQEATGWYHLAFQPHWMMNSYERIQNIVVKLASKKPSSSSLLINCHFDSVPTSPGASDDAFHCVVMLELLRVLSEKDAPSLPYNLIFLFNGAEENPLQASHAFISQHEWAKEVRAFINLEAAGAGGREVLFQAGPGNSWLVDAYAESVPHPYANVLAEEIFQSGLIPSDTDFRVFRDFGKVPGLDFAHARNGYVYHTKYDDISRIPLGSLQHTGENLLALIPKIMSSPEFVVGGKNSSKLSEDSMKDKSVFFDVMGLYMVKYSEGVGMAFNLITVFLSLAVIFGKRFGGFSGKSERNGGWKIIACSGVVLLGWIAGSLLTVGTAILLDCIGCHMSWFSRPALIFPLFYCPTLYGCLLPYVIFSRQNLASSLSEKYKVESMDKVYKDSLGVQLIWTIIVLAATIVKIRSGFVFTLLVIFPVLAHLIVALCYKIGLFTGEVKIWLMMHHIFSLIPVSLVFYFGDMGFSLFIPICARIGAKLNPDLLIGIIAIIMCILAFSHIIPLIHLTSSPKKILVSLLAIHLVAILAVAFTPIGFPYVGKQTEPSPQRVQVIHLRSRQHIPGNPGRMEQKNLFWMIDLDRNGAHFSLPRAVENGCQKMPEKMCEEVLHCGMPIYTSRMVQILPETHIAPAPEPIIHEPSSLKLISQKALSTRVRRLTFDIICSKRGSLFLSPAKGVSLNNWIFGEVPNATHFWQRDRPSYYVYHSIGLDSKEPWKVWIDLEVSQGWNEQSVVDIALVCHYSHGEPAFQATKAVNENMGPVASWGHLTAWTATYDSWKF